MNARVLFAGSVWFACSAGAVGAPGDYLWSYLTRGIVYSSPAIDRQGNLYVGSEDGDLYSLSPTGQVRWIYGKATDWIDSSPAVGPDGTVYVGSWDGFLYAVNGSTGTLKWKYDTGAPIIASPAVSASGAVYAGSYDGGLHAFSSTGSILWSYYTANEIESSPAVDQEGNIYFGNDDGIVYSLSPGGGLRWTCDLTTETAIANGDAAILSSPAVSGLGEVYVGTRGGVLVALDAALGEVLWTYPAADYIDSSPAVGPYGSVVFAARDGYLYKLSRDGVLRWERLIGDVFYGSPAIDAAGRIYLGAYLGDGLSAMYCLSPAGAVEWLFPFEGYNDSSPNLGTDGTVYFGAHNFEIYAIEGDAPLNPTSPWARFRGDSLQTGATDGGVQLSLPSPSLHWSEAGAILSWEGEGATLGEASSPSGPWSPAFDQTNPQVVAPGTTPRFFRVEE